jgi:hypothetical protein
LRHAANRYTAARRNRNASSQPYAPPSHREPVPNLIRPGTRFAELAARPPLDGDPEIEITFKVRRSKGPALRSAVDELRTIIGSRLEGSHKFAKEHSLTDAAITVSALAAAVNRAVPAGDPNYV